MTPTRLDLTAVRRYNPRNLSGTERSHEVAKRTKRTTKKRTAKRPAKSRVVSNLKSVAEHYGVRLDTVRKDWRGDGMPGQRGHWDLDEIDAWRSRRRSEKDRSGTLTMDGKSVREQDDQRPAQGELFDLGDAERAKVRGLLADADRKEADARLKRIQALKAENVGLVELNEVESFISAWLAEARNILKGVPVKCKRFGLDVQHAVDQELDLALHAIRKKSEQLVELRRDT